MILNFDHSIIIVNDAGFLHEIEKNTKEYVEKFDDPMVAA